MATPSRIRLTDAGKDALLLEQTALIERVAARIAELEAQLGKPRKTSANSSVPPSQDGPGRKEREQKRPRKARPSRPGSARALAANPERMERCFASSCPHCGAVVSETEQRRRARYDHVDLPIVRSEVTRVEVFGGRCRCPASGRSKP